MVHPVSVRALPNYRIHIRYSDDAEGIVDLSEYAGHGLFTRWQEPDFFAKAHIGPHRQIRWDDEIELCPDSVYLKLTGKNPTECFATPDLNPSHA